MKIGCICAGRAPSPIPGLASDPGEAGAWVRAWTGLEGKAQGFPGQDAGDRGQADHEGAFDGRNAGPCGGESVQQLHHPGLALFRGCPGLNSLTEGNTPLGVEQY